MVDTPGRLALLAVRALAAFLVLLPAAVTVVGSAASSPVGGAQTSGTSTDLDTRVSRFLESRRGTWRDMNVPEADGRALHDIILKNGYRRALEVGTSTGHSTIWIAWALAKTGGRVVTIEIDERRHRQALANFREAGVHPFIDARLADAHALVPQLDGPFDFVFIDADKDWYTNYARAILPKLAVGGCLAAHNVTPGRGRRSLTSDYYAFVTGLPNLETSILNWQLAVSYKRREP